MERDLHQFIHDDMTLRERQDRFLETFNRLSGWTERFNYLIGRSSGLMPECPQSLKPFRIESCLSRTYFLAAVRDGAIRAEGWSNSAVMGGIVAVCTDIFDGLPATELASTGIDFHTRSGLVSSMTPMRSDALRVIVRRLTVLLPPSAKSQLCP
jgi:cysteine desulfuration protein SufE